MGIDVIANSSATLFSIPMGTSQVSEIDFAYDADWWRVSLTAGTTYTFGLGLTNNSVLDPFLLLYNGAGLLLDFDDDSGPGLTSLITFTAYSTGTYYLSAEAFGTSVGYYALTAVASSVLPPSTDKIAPTISEVFPADGAAAISTKSNVIFKFSEPVLRGAGSVTVTSSGGYSATYDIASSSNLTLAGNTLTVNPGVDFPLDSEVQVSITAGALKDFSDNIFAGVNNYEFRTTNGATTKGTAAADLFTAGSGNAIIDGGAGIDMVNVFQKKGLFELNRAGAGFEMSRAGVGIDTLVNVERIHFLDGYVAIDLDGNAGKAYRLYQAAFNRIPDEPGLGYHINSLDKGASLTLVATGFINSAEFKSLYGNNVSNATLINQMYANVLHRAPDTAGLNYWVGLLDKNSLSREDVLVYFSESPENQAQVIGQIDNGIAYTFYG